ncbi:MAG: hypothetical protein NT040_19100 [Bacteroidetes bacterium]|nr:hypothetical protein [Bacteroidota bacterium]
MQLYVKLRDGFKNDTVSITVDGNEIYHKTGVTTDLTISFADGADVPVDNPVVMLEVLVKGGLRNAKEIRVKETPYVGVWIMDGKMELRATQEEVPMM